MSQISLIDAQVQCDSYDIRPYRPFFKEVLKRVLTGTLVKGNLLKSSWEIRDLKGIGEDQKDGVLTLDFNDPPIFNYYHSTKRARVEGGSFYKLSGYIRAEGLDAQPGVCLEAQDGRGWTKTHSAASTEKVSGTTDWQYVETVYETLPDATEVNVIARRIGEAGPLKGRASFKDVRLEKFVPDLDAMRVPYLSVNASKSADGNKVYLMVVNKNMDEAVTARVVIESGDTKLNSKGELSIMSPDTRLNSKSELSIMSPGASIMSPEPPFVPAEEGTAWVLNGPSVDATNEKDHDNVKVRERKFKVTRHMSQDTRHTAQDHTTQDTRHTAQDTRHTAQDTRHTAQDTGEQAFEFTFEPHSLTAIEINKK